MYFIGDTNTRGTYFFHSLQHNGWVVADLDTGKASLRNKLATIHVTDCYSDVIHLLTKRAGLGQDGDRWLVDGEQLIPLLRDYADDIEVLMVYYQDGTENPYGKTEQLAVKAVRKHGRRLGDGR